MRLAFAQGPPADARCDGGVAVARRRRGHHRQDGDHRVRLFPSRPDAQSARSRAHAGRLVVRFGRGGRRRHGAARDRLADQRLDDPAGFLLRRLRRQADARPYFARPRVDVVAHARPCRRVRALAGRQRADPRGARRLRCRRPRYAPDRGAGVSRDAGQPSRRCRRNSPSCARRSGTRPTPQTRAAFEDLVERLGASAVSRSICRKPIRRGVGRSARDHGGRHGA